MGYRMRNSESFKLSRQIEAGTDIARFMLLSSYNRINEIPDIIETIRRS